MNKFINNWDQYQLIDSGNGRKLERYRKILLDRPEVNAIWQPRLVDEWHNCNAKYDNITRKWILKHDLNWIVNYEGVKFKGYLSPAGHVGYFAEKQMHWDVIKQFSTNKRVLNLFGYTGVASLIALKEGAHVTHVDSSSTAIRIGKENQELSSLENGKIRWIHDDVVKFVKREMMRRQKYDLIMLDPPTFGYGTRREKWKIDTDLVSLLQICKILLKPKNSMVILNTYSNNLSTTDLIKISEDIFAKDNIKIKGGELFIKEENRGRIIPQSQYCVIEVEHLVS